MNKLGSLLRKYRIKKGISQNDLEVEIDAAFGSVSRFELGKVNPTKETLDKIINVLELNSLEAAQLYDLNIDYFAGLIKLVNQINISNDFEELIQNVVDEISDTLSLTGGAIYLKEGNDLCLKGLAMNKIAQAAVKFFPFPYTALYQKLKFETKTTSKNPIVQSALQKKIIVTEKLSDFMSPPIPRRIINQIQKAIKLKYIIAVPHIYKDEALGVSVFGKFNEMSEAEKMILEPFADAVAFKISILSNIS